MRVRLDDGKRIIGPELGPRPHWARGLIVAQLHTDQSDVMTDYFAHSTGCEVPLAWSRHTRDLFPEMRKAAALFKPTAHLGPGRDVWTVRSVYSIPDPGFFVYNGRAYHDGDFDHDPTTWAPSFTTEDEARAWVEAQPELRPCYHGETLAHYRWSVTRKSVEHREKWSMGSGYYLKAGGSHSSAWAVKKRTYDLESWDARIRAELEGAA